jgi:hypothetical protein
MSAAARSKVVWTSYARCSESCRRSSGVGVNGAGLRLNMRDMRDRRLRALTGLRTFPNARNSQRTLHTGGPKTKRERPPGAAALRRETRWPPVPDHGRRTIGYGLRWPENGKPPQRTGFETEVRSPPAGSLALEVAERLETARQR